LIFEVVSMFACGNKGSVWLCWYLKSQLHQAILLATGQRIHSPWSWWVVSDFVCAVTLG
jgi:hypothetical protein